MRKIIFSLIALAAAFQAWAQLDSAALRLTRGRAELLVPRPALHPVKSLIPPVTAVGIDTIATENPIVKIVLMSDGSYKYWKDPSEVLKEDTFNTFWDNYGSDPYRRTWESFPEKAYVWLVDDASQYCFPGNLDKIEVSSRYGYRRTRYHRGIDVRLPKGTPIYASFAGKVRMAKYISGYGNVVVIRHENGLETFYAHLSKMEAQRDDWVEAGQEIGLAGATGRASGSHLHYEVRYLGYAIDPEWIIDFSNGDLRHSVFTFKKQHLDPNFKFEPESDDEEELIALADEEDRLEAERLEAERKAAQYYVVKSGDTLSRIASRYHTTVNAICKLNNITAKSTLRVGQRLRVK